jgi:hypothetical protein
MMAWHQTVIMAVDLFSGVILCAVQKDPLIDGFGLVDVLHFMGPWPGQQQTWSVNWAVDI